MKRFVVKGINDDKSLCECCGKSGLARVVWIEDMETGEIKHFGTTCALKPSKGFDCSEDIKKAVRSIDWQIKNNGHAVMRQYKAAGGTFGPHPTDPYTRVATDKVMWESMWDAMVSRVYAERGAA